MSVRAKFRCDNIEPAQVGDNPPATIRLSPVTSGSPENESFYKFTPGGSLVLGTINAEAVKQFEVGKDYYVDISPAPCTPAASPEAAAPAAEAPPVAETPA